jgi:hypothetical protein
MNALLRIALLVCTVSTVLACTAAGAPGGATSAPSSSPSPSPAPSSTPIPSSAPTPPASPPANGNIRLDVSLVAGPTCPVERNPPDPNCAPRPVAGATIVIRDAGGAQVAQLTSDATGHATIDLAPGSYVVEAMPSAGIMGTPQPLTVQLADAASGLVTLMYDTGIR